MRTSSNSHQTTIEKLRQKLAYYEEDEVNLKMFKETLRLFRNKSLKKFEHEMELSKDVRVHLYMVPVDSAEYKIDSKAKAVEKYKSRLQQMEVEITKMKNYNLELNKINKDLKIKCGDVAIQQRETEIAVLKQETQALVQLTQVDQATEHAELEQKLAIVRASVDHLHKTNEELQDKLAHLEEEQKGLEVFAHALHLFESKSCRKFQHEIFVSNNEKIQLNMVLKENYDSNDDKEQFEQRQRELEALVTDLRRRLELAELERLENN